MKKINFKKVFSIGLIMFLIAFAYFAIYMYANESLSRISYELRKDKIFLNILIILSALIPIIFIPLHLIFRKKIKEDLNTSNMFYTLVILTILYTLIGIIFSTCSSYLLEKRIIGYCESALESSGSFLDPCFLSGIEYLTLSIYYFVPLVLILSFEILFFLYKKITKKEKLHFLDIVIVLIIFVILCFITWYITYTASLL